MNVVASGDAAPHSVEAASTGRAASLGAPRGLGARCPLSVRHLSVIVSSRRRVVAPTCVSVGGVHSRCPVWSYFPAGRTGSHGPRRDAPPLTHQRSTQLPRPPQPTCNKAKFITI